MKKRLSWLRSLMEIWFSGFRVIQCLLILLLISTTNVIANDNHFQSPMDFSEAENVVAEKDAVYVVEAEFQEYTVRGTVTDEAGETLIGVSVTVAGTVIGTVTDIDGQYEIDIPLDAETLVFSYVGMRIQEFSIQQIILDELIELNVTMIADPIGLDEVVVVGYGTARRRDITGAVRRVEVEDSPLAMAPSINALSMLRATTPGLNIGAVNTAGGSPSLLVRGQTSISASNYPLIVLDGVVFLGSITDINPSDIASVDVLKDASAAAIYGSRAANGVIFFTTKRGRTEKPILNYTSRTGIYNWNNKPEYISSERQLERTKLVLGLDNPEDFMFPVEREMYRAGITTNWQDIYSQTGHYLDNQFSVSGGLDNINYYMSAGYTDQKGVIVGDEYNRTSLRGRLNTDVTDWLEINLDATFNRSDHSGMGANLDNIMLGENYYPAYRGEIGDHTGLLEKWPRGEGRPGHNSDNPLWNTQRDVIEDIDIRDYYRLGSNANIKIPFVEGLSFRINYATNNRQFQQERFMYEDYYVTPGLSWDLNRYTPEALAGQLSLANARIDDRKINNYVWDNIVNYTRTFDQHHVDVTMVATRDYQSNRFFRNTGSDFLGNGNTLLGLDGITLAESQFISNDHVEWGNIGYLARINYAFNNRYHITGSFRRDGSSVFGAETKWGNFPSVGLAWTLSEEDFLLGNEFINYLKVRTSYGRNGNQGISAYETLARVSAGQAGGIRYQFGDQPGVSHYGLSIASLGNAQLGWETTTSFNVGLETALLRDRIFMDIDFYFSSTFDQLFTRQIPIMTGFSSIRASMGQVDNTGIELSLRTINLQNSDLRWTSHLTFWQNKNTLVELYGDGKDDIANNLFIGHSLGAIYGFDFIGIVQEDNIEYMQNTGARPGDAKFRDLSGDGQITFGEDRKILGYGKERFRLNLSNTVGYGNFELYVHLAGIFGGGGYYQAPNRSAYLSGQEQHIYTPLEKIQWWTPENPSNTYPSPFYYDGMFLGLQSRSFVRIQEIVLNYNLRSESLRDIRIESLRLFGTIQNLYTFTGWEGEPETGIGAVSTAYPLPASFSIGLDVRF